METENESPISLPLPEMPEMPEIMPEVETEIKPVPEVSNISVGKSVHKAFSVNPIKVTENVVRRSLLKK